MPYNVIYFDIANGYGVQDIETRDVVFVSESKSAVIGEAQRLNKFSPVDGDERTYAAQKKQAMKSRMKVKERK